MLVIAGLARLLDHPTSERALPIHEFVTHYRRDVEMIMTSTLEASAGLSGPEVAVLLESAIDDLEVKLDAGVMMSQVISTPRGPTTIEDFVATRIVELVVHTDDLNRSVPEVAPAALQRSGLSRCTRTSQASWRASVGPLRRGAGPATPRCNAGSAIQARHCSGHSAECRETDPLTFLRLATGRITWADAISDGTVHASGLRANLDPVLPHSTGTAVVRL